MKIYETIVVSKDPVRRSAIWLNPDTGDLKFWEDDEWHDMGSGGIPELVASTTYSDLKTLRDSGLLVPGMKYRITDYVTTTVQENTESAGHLFDIIVTADSASSLSPYASAAEHDGETYFSDSDLESWKIEYCLDNDSDTYTWADPDNGTGVIYRMVDENHNDCPYDFKNIRYIQRAGIEFHCASGPGYDSIAYRDPTHDTDTLFAFKAEYSNYGGADYIYFDTATPNVYSTPLTSTGNTNSTITLLSVVPTEYRYYTFSYGTDYSDASMLDVESCGYNKIAPYYSSGYVLNNIRFINVPYETTQFRYNEFSFDCHDDLFNNYTINNSFGRFYNNNTASIYFINNVFGPLCQLNTFGNITKNNTFGYYFFSNTLGRNFENNNIEQGFASNTVGENFKSNTIEHSFSSNTVGDNFYSNTVMGDCRSNTFSDDFSSNVIGVSFTNSVIGSYVSACSFGNNIRYISLETPGTSADIVKYYNVHSTVAGTSSSSRLSISAVSGLAYTTEVALNSNGELKTWCAADSVA